MRQALEEAKTVVLNRAAPLDNRLSDEVQQASSLQIRVHEHRELPRVLGGPPAGSTVE